MILTAVRSFRPLAAGLTVALAAWGLAPARGADPSGLQVAAAMENLLVDAIARGEKSVVAIARVKRDDPGNASREFKPNALGQLQGQKDPPRPGSPDFIPNEYGTGVVIDRDGLILTHGHVLGENSDYFVTTAQRKTYKARVKAADPRSDLAVLAIEASDLAPIKLGDASKLKKGQIVIALGNPYGIARDGQVSASWGIIANLGRKAAPTESEEGPVKPTLHQLGTLIQTDAKLNLGTSGGALVNLKGEMVGLTTSLAAGPGYEQAAGYAVPVDDTFRRVIETLKQGREVEYGLLGIAPENLKMETILAGKHGALVAAVYAGTPAERFGLRPNDVITHVNGEPVHDADGLVLEVGKLPVESTVRLTVDRAAEGRIVPINVQLAKHYVGGRKIVTTPAPAWRGLRVDYATAVKRLTSHASRELSSSVVVTEVEPGSPAAAVGLQPEMFISHVGSTPVATPKEFYSAVANKQGAVEVRLSIADPSLRSGTTRRETKTIQPQE